MFNPRFWPPSLRSVPWRRQPSPADEPHTNLTDVHAQRLAAWLKALATALHAEGHTLAVCVSDWGIIGPQYYGLIATAGADRYVSMGSTYKYQPITGRLNIRAMVKAFPLGSITVGIR